MSRLRRAGLEFPVSCYAAPPSQWRRPESILGELDPADRVGGRLDARFDAAGLFNGEIYALQRLRVRPELRLDARRGWYFDSLSSCEALELDLLAGRPRPLRLNPLDGRGRTAAIGVSVLTALRTSNGYDLLLGRIAPKAMPHRAGQLHVAPSGMFGPPWSILATVDMEMREELGVPAPADRVFLAGAAVNLLNLRPEICTLCVMDDPGALRLNAEFAPGLIRLPLGTDEAMARALDLQPASITPPGAAALFLGARLLRSRMANIWN
jgi:hypothetical protein